MGCGVDTGVTNRTVPLSRGYADAPGLLLTSVNETVTVVPMSDTVTVQTRVDPELKRDVDEILATLGLDMPTAIRMFLARVRLTLGIPFPLTTTSSQLVAAMNEADRLAADPGTRVYTDVHTMMSDILHESDPDE